MGSWKWKETIDVKTGIFILKQQFCQSNIANLFRDRSNVIVAKDDVKQKIKQTIHDQYIINWYNGLERILSRSGLGGNKLRTYRTFKYVYGTETYISRILPRRHRSAYAKFRCGVALIRLETGRYERLYVEIRTCFQRPQSMETEEHVLLSCLLYEALRLSYLIRLLLILLFMLL